MRWSASWARRPTISASTCLRWTRAICSRRSSWMDRCREKHSQWAKRTKSGSTWKAGKSPEDPYLQDYNAKQGKLFRMLGPHSYEPPEDGLPPQQIRVQTLRAEPWPEDSRRVRIHLDMTPFLER